MGSILFDDLDDVQAAIIPTPYHSPLARVLERKVKFVLDTDLPERILNGTQITFASSEGFACSITTYSFVHL